MLISIKAGIKKSKIFQKNKTKVKKVMAYRYCRCSSFPSSGARCPERFELPKSLQKYVESDKTI